MIGQAVRCRYSVSAGVDIGDEGFGPVGNELDGSAKHDREPDGRHFVGVGVDLNTERAADVLADYTYLVVF